MKPQTKMVLSSVAARIGRVVCRRRWRAYCDAQAQTLSKRTFVAASQGAFHVHLVTTPMSRESVCYAPVNPLVTTRVLSVVDCQRCRDIARRAGVSLFGV